jgi:hypothetical protein
MNIAASIPPFVQILRILIGPVMPVLSLKIVASKYMTLMVSIQP